VSALGGLWRALRRNRGRRARDVLLVAVRPVGAGAMAMSVWRSARGGTWGGTGVARVDIGILGCEDGHLWSMSGTGRRDLVSSSARDEKSSSSLGNTPSSSSSGSTSSTSQPISSL
jgi:hypothetical protein